MRWAEMSNLTIVKVCTATAVWCIAWVAMGLMSLHLLLNATALGKLLLCLAAGPAGHQP